MGVLFMLVTLASIRSSNELTGRGALCQEDASLAVFCSADQTDCEVECRNGIPIEQFCIPDRLITARHLTLNLDSCLVRSVKSIPTGIFQVGNQLRTLHIYSPGTSLPTSIVNMTSGTFANLENLEELTLDGFEFVKTTDLDFFSPLRNLRSLNLIGFGAQFLTYSQLGSALKGFSNSTLAHITMDSIHPIDNQEKVLDISALFPVSDVYITHLIFTGNDFNSVAGTLSSVLPHLRYIEFSMYWLTFAASSFGLDSMIFLKDIEEIYYAFIGSRNSYSDSSSRVICPLCVLNEDLMNYYLTLTDSDNCYIGKLIRLSSSLKRLTVQNMDFFKSDGHSDACFDDSQLEYVDFSRSPIDTVRGQFIGFRKLRHFNLQNTGLRGPSSKIFHDMPILEVLLLGGNDIGSALANDKEGDFFRYQNMTLRTLDLSNCKIGVIPNSLFSSLRSLQYLNLSGNKVEHFEVKIDQLLHLSILNLSRNALSTLSDQMISQFEFLKNNSHTNQTLRLDLTGNPFTCFCNNTEFVTWLKTTDAVTLQNFDEYSCRHPNGTKVTVSKLNITELKFNCKIREELKDDQACPCSGLEFPRLRQISLSLSDISCTNNDKSISYMELISNSSTLTQNYWWCQPEIPDSEPFEKSPKFIATVVIVCVILILLAILLVVIYKKRYSPSEIASMIQCMDMRPYIMYVIKAITDRSRSEPNEQSEFDLFVYYQKDDEAWAKELILSRTEHLAVITPLSFLGGAAMIDAILDAVKNCHAIMLILSSSFKEDEWCREVSLRSYTSRPAAVIPVLKQDTSLSIFQDDLLFANLVATNIPVRLMADDVESDFIWSDLMARIYSTV